MDKWLEKKLAKILRHLQIWKKSSHFKKSFFDNIDMISSMARFKMQSKAVLPPINIDSDINFDL